MTSSAGGGLSRVTVLAPNGRLDVAVPTNVPVGSLLPALLGRVGGDPGPGGGWALSRIGGQVLDDGRSPAQLDLRDGEVLYLTPRAQVATPVRVLGRADGGDRPDVYRPGGPLTARRVATGLGRLALLGGALAVLLAGPPQLPGALAGLGVGVALIAVAAVLARVRHASRPATGLGLLALLYTGVGGLLLLAGDRPVHRLAAPDVLVAATAVILSAAVTTLAVGVATPVFLGAAVAGVALAAGTVIDLTSGLAPAGAAAIIGAVAFAVIPALPMLSYRVARLPIPTVPADLSTDSDTEPVDGDRVLARTDRADALLTGFVGTVAAILAVTEVVVALGGRRGLLLCAVLAPLLLLRARPLRGTAQRLPLLAAGALGLGLVALAGFLAGSPTVRLTAVLLGLLLAAGAAAAYGFGVAGRPLTPVWGRLLDLAEVALILALIPLAAWVCGLYDWIRAIGP